MSDELATPSSDVLYDALSESTEGGLTGQPISSEHSSFLRELLEIADREGDFISEATIKKLEEMMGSDDDDDEHPGEAPEEGEEDGEHPEEEEVVARTLTRKPFHISPEQMAATKNVADVLKQMTEAGKFIFSKVKKIKAWLGPIGKVAGIVKDVVEFFEEAKPDPVMKELEEVQKQLTVLSQKMSIQFDDLKAFIVEQEFFNRFTVSISTLNMYLLDVLQHYSKDALKAFEEYYKEKRPQKLVYEMLAKLEIDSSNPLLWAMKGDSMQTSRTFFKWSDILESVLTQALFLETFACGLLDDVSDHATNMIIAKLARYYELNKQWFDYYAKNPDYWQKGVGNMVADVHQQRSNYSIQDKAKFIMEHLDKVLTADKFYVVVFEDHIWASIDTRPDQIFYSQRDTTNYFIYRTSDYDRSRLNIAKAYCERKSVSDGYYGAMSIGYNHWTNVRVFAKDINAGRHFSIKKYNFPICGFVLMVAQKKELVAAEWSSVGFFWDPKNWWAHGPGYATYDAKLTSKNSGGKDTFPLFWLFGV